jgi:hypothetical protein
MLESSRNVTIFRRSGMDYKQRKINRMATWTITVFATAFAVVMSVMWLVKYPITAGSSFHIVMEVLGSVWVIVLVTAVLCILAFIGYSYYLDRRG